MNSVYKDTDSISPSVLVADKAGATVLRSALARAGISEPTVLSPRRGWSNTAKKKLKNNKGFLIIVPSKQFGPEAVTIVSEIRKNHGFTIVWSAGVSPSGDKTDERWLLEKLLQQKGAFCTSETAVVAALIKFLESRSIIGKRVIEVRGAKSSVGERLIHYLASAPVPQGKGAQALTLYVAENGEISLEKNSGDGSNLGDPHTVVSALSLFFGVDLEEHLETVPPPADSRELSLILGPPRRLLSETASKKIVAAYNMRLPEEQLCQSPSEASRYAAKLGGGPVVVKLVKPWLENKKSLGAVVTNVVGGPSVRRAVQTLEGLGISLGPPRPLGILVSEQIDGLAAVWMKMVDHPRFGRLLFGGSGNSMKELPSFGLSAPASETEAYQALWSSGEFTSSRCVRILSKGVSRFSEVVDHLGPHIERAEVHPLVVAETNDGEPIVLDALFSISGE